LHSTPPLGGFPSEYRHSLWYRKTRMVSLPDGEKISKICLFVLTGSTNVSDRRTDRRTDGRTLHDSKDRAYASHRAVKTMPRCSGQPGQYVYVGVSRRKIPRSRAYTIAEKAIRFRVPASGLCTISGSGSKINQLRPCPDICRHATFHSNPCTRF